MRGGGQKKNLKMWQPGQSGNPSGRYCLPAEIRKARKANQVALIQMVSRLFTLPMNEFKEKSQDQTVLETAVRKVITNATEGNLWAFSYLIEVMAGKLPETDFDGFSEEDLRILERVKQFYAEQQDSIETETSDQESH